LLIAAHGRFQAYGLPMKILLTGNCFLTVGIAADVWELITI